MDINKAKDGIISDDVIAQTYERNAINGLTSDIVASYVSHNHINIDDLPRLINTVRDALSEKPAETAATAGPEKPTPSEIKKSISRDALISFEDGKPYKTLRRHLTLRGMTPESYRAKWGLPADYPMTSPAYSEQRSELARALGLGQQRRKSVQKQRKKEPATAGA